jgi:isopenicillin N synthase-like dioxygenase
MGLLESISIDGTPRVGRMLYYRKSGNTAAENPFWCGSHLDHGMFTALLPAFYFVNGQAVAEPREAGLFVKTTHDGVFKKVMADDPDVMLFQVGEFGQLVTNDAIRATEHRVHKASGTVERYTMALFFDAPMETVIRSTSELTKDSRYGAAAGEPCTYLRWHEESFKRYIVKD